MSKACVARLLGDPGVEDDLEQHVAELLGEVGRVAGADGVDDLVGLLDEVGGEGLVGLLGVPGAAAGRAQPVHRRDDVEEAPTLHVPRPDDELDVRGWVEARHLGSHGVGEPGVAVGRAEPHDRHAGREVDEPASEHRRRLVPHLLDGEPGLDDRLGEGVVDGAREPHGRARDDLPGAAGEQPRSDPGRGDEQPEPAGGHCAASAEVIHSGVVSWIDAVFGS